MLSIDNRLNLMRGILLSLHNEKGEELDIPDPVMEPNDFNELVSYVFDVVSDGDESCFEIFLSLSIKDQVSSVIPLIMDWESSYTVSLYEVKVGQILCEVEHSEISQRTYAIPIKIGEDLVEIILIRPQGFRRKIVHTNLLRSAFYPIKSRSYRAEDINEIWIRLQGSREYLRDQFTLLDLVESYLR